MSPFRLIFFGTSGFAVPILERLAKDTRFEVTAVVTQPDRPVGRHAEVMASPIKQAALKLGLPVLQPESVKTDEAFALLEQHPADVYVVASYGQIIPQRVLDLPKHGAINVHGSILPAYRGASPIAAAIANGDASTGITIMLMDAKMDHGPTLGWSHELILPEDTTRTLEPRLAERGADLLPIVLEEYLNGERQPTEQNHEKATFVKLLKREDGKLDPLTQTAEQMERLVRAYEPWPGTYLEIEGKRLKIFEASVVPLLSSRAEQQQSRGISSTPHTVIDGSPAIVCFDGSTLKLLRVQPEGKKEMSGEEFLRGMKNWAAN
jgi:methionyl-tRNA formyltransferase